MNTLGENLRRYRGGLSQTDFAKKLGLKNQQTYQRYEEGTRQPRMTVLHHMAGVIGVSVPQLLGLPDAHDSASFAQKEKEAYSEERQVIREVEVRISQFKQNHKYVRDSLINSIVDRLNSYSEYCEKHNEALRKAASEAIRSARGEKVE